MAMSKRQRRRPRQPAVEKCLQPGAFGHVMDRAVGEVMVARAGARQSEAFVAARGPAMHHRVGHVGMKLKAERVAGAERLDRKIAALRQQFAALGQIETLAMPVIDVIRPVRADRAARRRWGGSDNIRSARGLPDAAPPARQAACASICAPRQIPRNGRCSRSGTAIQSISRRTKSSGSLALIGPPKITAPAWPSSVSGKGSPKRGRLMSSGCPSARSALPTRPGVEVSWCRTISTGSSGLAFEEAGWLRVLMNRSGIMPLIG